MINKEVAYEPYGPSGIAGFTSNKYCLIASLFASIGGFSFGYDQGFLSSILVFPTFTSTFPQLETGHPSASFYSGLVTAVLQLGGAVGALNMGWMADRFSRKWTMVISSAVLIIGTIIQTASMNYGALVAGRLIAGIGIGALAAVAPLYMSEIAPAEVRGALMVLESFFIVTGNVVAYWISYGTRGIPGSWSFRLPFLLQAIPCLILVSYVPFLPYSPRWLASRGRQDDALATLIKIRGFPAEDHRIQREFLDIIVDTRLDSEAIIERHPHLQTGSTFNLFKLEMYGMADLFDRKSWRRVWVAMMLVFFQEFIGINGVIYYTPILFGTLGLDEHTRLILSGMINIFQLAGVTAAMYLIDRLGRRKLLIGGGLGCFFAMLILAVLVGLYANSWASNASKGWAGVAMVFVYMVSFGVSWSPIPWLMPSEVFTTSMRAKGVSVAICTQWFANFIIGLITAPMITNIGFGTYIFFGFFAIAAVVWTFFFAPETMNLSLEATDEVFNDSLGKHDEMLRRRIEGELLGSQSLNDVSRFDVTESVERKDGEKGQVEHVEKV